MCGCNRSRTYTASNPLVVGAANGAPPVYLRASVSIMGLKANSAFWGTGDGVEAMVGAGWLTLL